MIKVVFYGFVQLAKFIAIVILFVLGLVVLNYLRVIYFVESESGESLTSVQTQFIDVSEAKIVYSEYSDKSSTTIMFIGGLAAWQGTWEKAITDVQSDVSQTYNYVTIDLPPFGLSKISPDGSYFRDVQAKRLLDFIAAYKAVNLNVKNIILVAHSYGAGPGTEAVMRDEEGIIKKLIIVDGVLNVGEKKVVKVPLLLSLDFVRDILIGTSLHSEFVARKQLLSFVSVKESITDEVQEVYTKPLVIQGTTGRISDWALDYLSDPLVYLSTDAGEYEEIEIPVVLIWGEDDTLTPLALTEILMQKVPNIRLLQLKGVGHIPMIEGRTLFKEALLEALENN